MPAPIYLPQQPYPRQNMFTQLLPQLLMQGLAYKQRGKLLEDEREYVEKVQKEERLRTAEIERRKAIYQAQQEGRDVIEDDTLKGPPQGYSQYPGSENTYISKNVKAPVVTSEGKRIGSFVGGKLVADPDEYEDIGEFEYQGVKVYAQRKKNTNEIFLHTIKPSSKTGTLIQSGDTTVWQGPLEGVSKIPNLGKTVTGDIQKEVVSLDDSIASMQELFTSWRPEFNTLSGKWSAMISGAKSYTRGTPIETILGGKNTPEEIELLEAYGAYKSDHAKVLKDAVEQFGANLSKHELAIVKDEIPDDGDGLLSGDPPEVFQKKAIKTYSNLLWTRARRIYYLNNNTDPKAYEKAVKEGRVMSLDETKKAIHKRGEAIAKELRERNPTYTAEQIKEQTTKLLKQIYKLGVF